MIPAAGSAYTYSYVVLGELARLDHRLEPDPRIFPGGAARSRSAGRATRCGFLNELGVDLPDALIAAGRMRAAIINLPAVFIVARGHRPAAARHPRERHGQRRPGRHQDRRPDRLRRRRPAGFRRRPISSRSCPYGFGSASAPTGVKRGVMAAAAIIFFAFYGFDAISTAAEEAKNPGRDLTIGIVGSMVALHRSSTWWSPPRRSAPCPTPTSPTAPSRWR